MAKETKKPGVPATAGAVTAYDWSQEKTTGLEATRQEDLGIPYLAILQSMSPQIKKTDPNYATKKIDGAGEGDIINTLSNTVVYVQGRDPIQFIPCYHERMFVEWKPRNSGGGIVHAHRNAIILRECTRNERGQDILKNGNIIVTTSYFYGLLIDDGGTIPCIIGMSSTQLKKARSWLNQITSIRLQGPNGPFMPPIFSHIYNLSTVPESNEEGSWFGWKIDIAGQLNDGALINKAKTMAVETAASQRAALPAPVDSKSDDVPFA